MPYKNPGQQRSYQRDYARTRRALAGFCQTPGQFPIPSEFRLKTDTDVLNLIAEQVAAVGTDEQAGTLEKARAIGYLVGVALKAVEAAKLLQRVEAVEKAIKDRKEATPCETPWPSTTTH